MMMKREGTWPGPHGVRYGMERPTTLRDPRHRLRGTCSIKRRRYLGTDDSERLMYTNLESRDSQH